MKRASVFGAALLLATACAKEQNARSEAVRDSTPVVAPDTAARCGLAPPLQCADRGYLAFYEQTVALLVPKYHLPTAEDSKGYWKMFDSFVYKTTDDADSTKAPYWTKGDFNNDGTTDYAYILIAREDSAMALFAFISGGRGYAAMLLADTIDGEMGLATQGRGTFTTAAGKGYWPVTAEEPAEVRVEKHAIAFFMFEGAGSLFVWDARKQRFVRVWMSD